MSLLRAGYGKDGAHEMECVCGYRVAVIPVLPRQDAWELVGGLFDEHLARHGRVVFVADDHQVVS